MALLLDCRPEPEREKFASRVVRSTQSREARRLVDSSILGFDCVRSVARVYSCSSPKVSDGILDTFKVERCSQSEPTIPTMSRRSSKTLEALNESRVSWCAVDTRRRLSVHMVSVSSDSAVDGIVVLVSRPVVREQVALSIDLVKPTVSHKSLRSGR